MMTHKLELDFDLVDPIPLKRRRLSSSIEIMNSGNDKSDKNHPSWSLSSEKVTVPLPTNQDLLTRIGGDNAVRSIVSICCRRVLRDSYLEFFLRDIDMEAARPHLENLFREIVVADDNHVDSIVARVQEYMLLNHERLFNLGLKEGHFDMLIGHLVVSMEALGIDRALGVEVSGAILEFRQIIELGSSEARAKQAFARNSLKL